MKRPTTEQDFEGFNSFFPDDCKFLILPRPNNAYSDEYMKWWEEMMNRVNLSFEKYRKKYIKLNSS